MKTAPNPCGARASISFDLVTPGVVELSLHDVAGRRVRTLIDGRLGAGSHLLEWDGRDNQGRPLAPGVYFARLGSRGGIATQKLVIVR